MISMLLTKALGQASALAFVFGDGVFFPGAQSLSHGEVGAVTDWLAG